MSLMVCVFLDGKKNAAKEIVEAIDEENKMVKFKVIEGDFLKSYKSIAFTVHIDTKGANDQVNWTIEYEKLNPNIPEPYTEMEFLRQLTKDIEAHHLQ